MEPATMDQATMEPATEDQSIMEPATVESAIMKPAAMDQATMEPAPEDQPMMEQAFMEQVTMEPATMEPVVMDQASITGPHWAAQACVMDHHSPGCRALNDHSVTVTTEPLNTRVLPLVEEAKDEVAWEVDRSEKIVSATSPTEEPWSLPLRHRRTKARE